MRNQSNVVLRHGSYIGAKRCYARLTSKLSRYSLQKLNDETNFHYLTCCKKCRNLLLQIEQRLKKLGIVETLSK